MKDQLEKEYLLDVARSKQSWINGFIEAIESEQIPVWVKNEKAFKEFKNLLKNTEEKEIAKEVLEEILSGFAHSILVGLDGGTELAEKFTIELHTSQGNQLNNYLHELWPEAEEEYSAKYK